MTISFYMKFVEDIYGKSSLFSNELDKKKENMFFKKNKKILETANVLIEKFNSIDSRINKLEHTIDRAIKELKHSDTEFLKLKKKLLDSFQSDLNDKVEEVSYIMKELINIKELINTSIDNIIKDKLESIFNNFVPKKEFNNHFAALLQLSNNIFESVNKIKYSTNKKPIEELK